MDPDHGPDTLPLQDEAALWAATQMDDVFDPAVRITLGWRDVEAAVQQGAVVPAQAHALWAGWAAHGAPQRMAQPVAPARAAAAQPVAGALLLPPPAPRRSGASPSVLLGSTLAAALVGAVLSYALFGH